LADLTTPTRDIARGLRARAVHGPHLAELPPRVALFYMRAWRLRGRLGDTFSLAGATKPRELAPLLRAARGTRLAVEVGTGTGWTAIALALAAPARRVVSFDPVRRPERDHYVGLVDSTVADRIDFVDQPGEQVPEDLHDVDFLFIDAAHDRASTLGAFNAWRSRLAPGAAVAFHDFNDPRWPGVTQAIRELGLRGHARDHLFVWRSPFRGEGA
jgi:SAM-dependent methyltransferase